MFTSSFVQADSNALDIDRVPVGYKFDPSDEEMIDHYLTGKILGFCSLSSNRIIQVEDDVFRHHPEFLTEKENYKALWKKNKALYFFTHLEGKHSQSGQYKNRTIGDDGYWKANKGSTKICCVKERNNEEDLAQQFHEEDRGEVAFGSKRKNRSGKCSSAASVSSTTKRSKRVDYEAQTIGWKCTFTFMEGKSPQGFRTNYRMTEFRVSEAHLKDIRRNIATGSSSANSENKVLVVCKIYCIGPYYQSSGNVYGDDHSNNNQQERVGTTADCLDDGIYKNLDDFMELHDIPIPAVQHDYQSLLDRGDYDWQDILAWGTDDFSEFFYDHPNSSDIWDFIESIDINNQANDMDQDMSQENQQVSETYWNINNQAIFAEQVPLDISDVTLHVSVSASSSDHHFNPTLAHLMAFPPDIDE